MVDKKTASSVYSEGFEKASYKYDDDSDDEDLPTLSQVFADIKKSHIIKAREQEKENEPTTLKKARLDVDKPPKTSSKLESVTVEPLKTNLKPEIKELAPGTHVFALNSTLKVYSPAEVSKKTKSGKDLYEVFFYDGSKETCHRKYIYSVNDPAFFTVKLQPINDVMEHLQPTLDKQGCARLGGLVKSFDSDLRKIILGKAESERDNIFFFNQQQKASLYTMCRSGPFSQPEYEYISDFLVDLYTNACGLVNSIDRMFSFKNDSSQFTTDFGKEVNERFTKCGSVFKASFPVYVRLVLAPEFILRYIVSTDKSIKTLEEADSALMDKEFNRITAYVEKLYNLREIYCHARGERVN